MNNPPTKITSNSRVKPTDELVSYWKQQLAGASDRLEFPALQPHSSRPTFGPASFTFKISKICTNALCHISHQFNSNLSLFLFSAFNILLYRYTNQTDLLVGYATDDFDNDDDLIEGGRTIFPLRANLLHNPFFPELLQHITETAACANQHKNVPAELFKDLLLKNKGPERKPLLAVTFLFRDTILQRMKNNHQPGNANGNPGQLSNNDLNLSMEKTIQGLEGTLEYNAELFETCTITRMMENFQVLLDGIIYNPNQRIAHISLLSEAERYKLMIEWNTTSVSYPIDRCIHELFEEQVSRSPDAIAAKFYNGIDKSFFETKDQLSYSELNNRANQLAHYLILQGVAPEVLVGICMKRSLDMVIALIGILKAGGAYLPLDPALPKDRLNFMLEDSGLDIVLCHSEWEHNLQSPDRKVIRMDKDWDNIQLLTDENPPCKVGPTNLAYVIYTSGSTGTPKGTLIMHRGVVNYLSWATKTYKVADGTGCPVNSSLGFDATVTSFLSPLMVGKHLLLLPEEGEIEALKNVLCSNNNFSLAKITPAHLEILNNLLPSNGMEGQVNALIIGGEALTAKSLKFWHKYAPATRLINEYGPTETVVGCCTYEVSPQNPIPENIPIGRPIANTKIYLLDQHLQPVPIGAIGEIYIGGPGLARGYLNRPQLTAERFISNPFSSDPGSRLYKTGDQARFLNDGNLVFLGRNDHQVKIRGYRIELGEIESIIGQHPQVLQSAVMVREDTPGDKRIVAYLVLDSNPPITTKELKLFVGEKLPEYMVPSVIVLLPTLPLTNNGKVDRAALPVPTQQRQNLETTYVKAGTKLEKKLAKLFEQSMKINPIGIQDNFFELGLNSMQAYRLFAQIKRISGIQLPLSILFQAPTISQLAAYLQAKDATAPWSSLVPIQPRGSKLPLFCIHAGTGTVLFYRELSLYLGKDQPVYGLQPVGLDGKQRFHKSIEEMASHYITEIRRINPNGPYLLGGYCFGGVIAFEMAQQLISQGLEIALLANFNAVSPTFHHPFSSILNRKNDEKPRPSLKAAGKLAGSRLKKLTQLRTKDNFIFLLRKIKARLKKQINLLKLKAYYSYAMLVMFIYHTLEAMGIQCPETFRKYYFHFTNSNMVKEYKPKSYPGRLTIFRSPGIYKDPSLGWKDYVSGEIKTCDIPGQHNGRRQILNEPFVRFTAEELKKEMNEYKAGAF